MPRSPQNLECHLLGPNEAIFRFFRSRLIFDPSRSIAAAKRVSSHLGPQFALPC